MAVGGGRCPAEAKSRRAEAGIGIGGERRNPECLGSLTCFLLSNLCSFDDKEKLWNFRILAPQGNESNNFEKKTDSGKLLCFETSFPCSGNDIYPVELFFKIDS